MKKLFLKCICTILVLSSLSFSASAVTTKYTVVPGDSMWKIAVKFQVGLSEIISANPQIKNPALIYPKQVLSIPRVAEATTNYEQRVIDLVNQRRAQNGLSPLKANWQLSRVARMKSQEMHDKHYFSHTSPTYGSPFTMMNNFGIHFTAAGENIAMGQTTPEAVMNAWMNSPGHRANILNSSYTQIGVGYVPDGHYWTQEFIRP